MPFTATMATPAVHPHAPPMYNISQAMDRTLAPRVATSPAVAVDEEADEDEKNADWNGTGRHDDAIAAVAGTLPGNRPRWVAANVLKPAESTAPTAAVTAAIDCGAPFEMARRDGSCAVTAATAFQRPVSPDAQAFLPCRVSSPRSHQPAARPERANMFLRSGNDSNKKKEKKTAFQ